MTDFITSADTAVNNTSSAALTMPSGIETGDVLYAFVVGSAGTGSDASMTGWVEEADVSRSTNSRITLFSRTSDGTEGATQTASFTTATDVVAKVLRFPSGTTLDATTTTASGFYSTDASAPSITTTSDDTLLIRAICYRSSSGSFAAPNTALSTVTQDSTSLVSGKQQQATAGASSSEVFTITNSTNAALMTVAFVSPSASASLDDVGVSDTITDGAIGTQFNVSGFGSDITSFKVLEGANETAGTNLSGSGTAYTIDLPDVTQYTSNTVGAPLTSAAHSITAEVGDGTDTATLAVTYATKAGWALVDIASALADDSSVFDQVYGDDSQCYYDTSNNTTIAANGVFTTDGSSIDLAIWDISDSTWKPGTVIVNPEPDGGHTTGVRSSIRNSIRNSIRTTVR